MGVVRRTISPHAARLRREMTDAHLGIVPIITTPGKDGTSDVTILGFALFFVENAIPSNGALGGYFISDKVNGVAITTTGGTTTTQPNSGPLVIYLAS